MSAPLFPYLIAVPKYLFSLYFLSAPKVRPRVRICLAFSKEVSSKLPKEISAWFQKDQSDFLFSLSV